MNDLVILLVVMGIKIIVGIKIVMEILQYRVQFSSGSVGEGTETDTTVATTAEDTPAVDVDPNARTDVPVPTEATDAYPYTDSVAGKIDALISRAITATPHMVGLALLAAGIAVWVLPGLVPPGVATQVEQLGDAPETPFLLLGGLVGAIGLLIVTFGSRPETQRTIGDVDPPEPVSQSTAVALTGQHLDDLVDDLVTESDDETVAHRSQMRTYLQEIIAESLVTHRGWSRARADRSVEDGSWTPKPEVAAFVGGDDAPDMPLWWKLRDWLSADSAYERRVRRSVAELDRVTGRGRVR